MGEESDRRSQFRSRYLQDEDSVFQHNAWDNVLWDEEQEALALMKVSDNSNIKIDSTSYVTEAHKHWDSFYGVHQNRFFKDRHWLFIEFPELESEQQNKDNFNILEIGCGVGNTIFPILDYCKNSNVFVYGCDFSTTAVQLVTEHPDYDKNRCLAFVCDVSSNDWEPPFENESLDIVIMVFILSAVHPEKMKTVVKQINKYLKPGGLVLFRDYGRFDLAQLRFKSGQCLGDNLYARKDGTMVYFFTQDEVRNLFVEEGFVEEQNLIDRRLQVNRGKQLKMYRVWIQAKYRKVELDTTSTI